MQNPNNRIYNNFLWPMHLLATATCGLFGCKQLIPF